MAHPSVAQAQATSPTTTGVMVILTVKGGVTREQVMAVMPAEIRQTVQLYLNGQIREWYSRADGRGVVLLLDTRDVAEAGDYGGPTAGQTEPYGPRVHRSRSTFAAPLTHGQPLSASKKREAHMEYRR
jgi:hypothetical protein